MSKKIVITGTSRGIGFELAKQFADAKHHVLALSRDTSTINALQHPNITVISVDLSKEEDLQKAADFVADSWEHVDVLIHNAGSLINKPFTALTQQDFLDVYQVNVFGVAGLTQKMIPFLNKGSHVVTISSMGGVQGSLKFPGLAAYSSAKGAVITLSELLAEEYKEEGISFNVLALGAVQTEMLEAAFPGYEAPVKAAEMARYIVDFSLTGNQFYNGKTLPVSSTNP